MTREQFQYEDVVLPVNVGNHVVAIRRYHDNLISRIEFFVLKRHLLNKLGSCCIAVNSQSRWGVLFYV